MGIRLGMKYLYAVVVKGKLEKFSADNKTLLQARVETFFRERGMAIDSASISTSIDRQSKIREKPKKIGLADAAIGAKALIKNLMGSSVSSEEIIRRSSICATCPLMSRIGGCASCGAGGKIANWINGIRAGKKLQIAIPSEVSSSYCGVCQCALALMVVTKKADFYDESKNGQRPDVCWLKSNSPNLTNE
jgi:hypothetical protein